MDTENIWWILAKAKESYGAFNLNLNTQLVSEHSVMMGMH